MLTAALLSVLVTVTEAVIAAPSKVTPVGALLPPA